METQDLINTEVGTKEIPKLKPSKVSIVGVSIKDKKNDGTLMKTPLVQVLVKHPEKEEAIEMTKIKTIRNEKVVSVVGLWCQLDEDNNFQKGSAVSELLSFLEAKSLKEIEGKEIQAVEEGNGSDYLCLKAY